MVITFVCTGNTCRSAMAQGMGEKILSDRKIEDITCRSCGLAAFTGDSATPLAVNSAKKLGVDISSHRASAITPYIIDETDVMVCMTQRHKMAVKSVAPELKILVPESGISDPYGGDEDVYDECAKEIYSYVEKIIDSLTMTIVPMSDEHISQIAEIEKQCFSAPWSENALKEELANENAHFLAGVVGENVLGYIGVHEICGEAYIANVAVRSDYRRLGIGEKLLETAQNNAFERGCEFISLEVRKSNASAVALYTKQGYNIVGERKSFYTNPTEDAIIMTLKESEINEDTLN